MRRKGAAVGKAEKRFTGILAKPIPTELRKGTTAYWGRKQGASPIVIVLSGGSASNDIEYLRECERLYNEQFKLRMDALFEHYGISTSEPGALAGLVLRMAEAFVPAFNKSEPPKRGPKTKWTQTRYAELAADVEKVKQERNCGDLHACRLLIERARKAGKGRYLNLKLPLDKAARALNSRLVEARHPVNTPFGIASLRNVAAENHAAAIRLLVEMYGSTNIRE